MTILRYLKYTGSMPTDQERTRYAEQMRRLATRQASAALTQAQSELTTTERRALPKGYQPRAILKPIAQDPGVWARASNPVTFTTGAGGRLATTNPLGTARHETAHLVGAGHTAIAASGTQDSALGLRGVSAAQREGPMRNIQRIMVQRARAKEASRVVKGKTDRDRQFQTKQNLQFRSLGIDY